jgi:NADH-quinone oxidoreductase subunit E
VSAIPPTSGNLGAATGAAGGAASRAAQAAAAKALAERIGEVVDTPAPVVPVAFPPKEIKERCDEIVARYPTPVAAALPILHLAQAHFDGWVSPEVEAGVAKYLGVSDQHIRGLLTFYAMYHTEPRGRHEVWVCRTLTCWLRGAAELTHLAREKAGLLRDGAPALKTSEDGRFTVMEMECLGLCEVAPAVFVDGEPHVNVTKEQFSQLLDACK